MQDHYSDPWCHRVDFKGVTPLRSVHNVCECVRNYLYYLTLILTHLYYINLGGKNYIKMHLTTYYVSLFQGRETDLTFIDILTCYSSTETDEEETPCFV